MPSPLQPDSRAAQIERVAAFLERNPGSTLRQIEAACDTGSVTKVLSVMRHPSMGYAIKRERRLMPCNNWRNGRRVACYWLIARPSAKQGELFANT